MDKSKYSEKSTSYVSGVEVAKAILNVAREKDIESDEWDTYVSTALDIDCTQMFKKIETVEYIPVESAEDHIITQTEENTQ